MCDIYFGMATLSEHIKGEPEKSITAWAADLGVSRPYLYGLLDGTRTPSAETATRIARATGNAVPVTSWPNLRAVIDAAQSGDAA